MKSVCVFAVCGLVSFFVLGCQPDAEIRHYQVPKEPQAEQGPSAPGKVRLLAAILPHADDTWFFKLAGPTDEVTANEAVFDRFIQSIRFPDQGKEPITWTVPEGWRQEGATGFRYATFHLGAKDKPLDLTVFKFDRRAGSMLDNVNRWRKLDLGLRDVTEADLGRFTKAIDVAGVQATWVDMTGPGAVKKSPMKP